MEQKIGRLLKSNEHVHHKDGNRLNNKLKNLELVTPQEHNALHYVYKGDNVSCEFCGTGFRVRPFDKKRQRAFFCSRDHYREYVKINNWGRKK